MRDWPDEDPYEVLEVSHRASPEAIVGAHRALINKYHPDKMGGLGVHAARINAARDQLLDLEWRAAYDAEWLRRNGPQPLAFGARQGASATQAQGRSTATKGTTSDGPADATGRGGQASKNGRDNSGWPAPDQHREPVTGKPISSYLPQTRTSWLALGVLLAVVGSFAVLDAPLSFVILAPALIPPLAASPSRRGWQATSACILLVVEAGPMLLAGIALLVGWNSALKAPGGAMVALAAGGFIAAAGVWGGNRWGRMAAAVVAGVTLVAGLLLLVLFPILAGGHVDPSSVPWVVAPAGVLSLLPAIHPGVSERAGVEAAGGSETG